VQNVVTVIGLMFISLSSFAGTARVDLQPVLSCKTGAFDFGYDIKVFRDSISGKFASTVHTFNNWGPSQDLLDGPVEVELVVPKHTKGCALEVRRTEDIKDPIRFQINRELSKEQALTGHLFNIESFSGLDCEEVKVGFLQSLPSCGQGFKSAYSTENASLITATLVAPMVCKVAEANMGDYPELKDLSKSCDQIIESKALSAGDSEATSRAVDFILNLNQFFDDLNTALAGSRTSRDDVHGLLVEQLKKHNLLAAKP
jgi:hypothetical protein